MAEQDRWIVNECLHEGPVLSLYRARDTQGGTPVVLKRPTPGADPKEAAEWLRREHAILAELDLPGVVPTLGLAEQDGVPTLVLLDFGGEALSGYLARQRLDLAQVLAVGAELAGTVAELHARRVIHRDINPRNILIDGARRTQIIDFNLATRLPRELLSFRHPNVLFGTLAYISPEQTGRMNRPIDYRTDLYSLGATLYTMLTGQPPFAARDPLELVHAHLARRPTPPAELDPTLPRVVSDIVLKLLAKAPEERYQSGFGLRADLEECLRRLQQDGTIAPFPLGQKDVSDRFALPQKLYGRQEQIAALEEAFERALQGAPELVMVAGASGTSKSAVIHELSRSLSRRRGFFASGKFDERKRDVPYSAVLQALDELLHYLLAEDEHSLGAFRREIREALGSVGQVVTQVLPELSLIIGPQPPLPPLDPEGGRRRFQWAFQRFLRVFARPGHPLVLFLDDLQWADAASLDLISALLGDAEAGALLVIGAFRDNEVTASHPLSLVIEELKSRGLRTSSIMVQPLSPTDVHALCADTLARAPDEVAELGDLVWKKTHGNAFFAGQFLTMLYKQGLVEFDTARLCWTWDLSRIAAAPITDNVVELMIARASALAPRTREALELGACIGDHFDLDTLALVAERTPQETEAALAEAALEGFVLSQGGGASYRFLHDRVQQACYSSIDEAQRAAVHARIGRHLLERARGRGALSEELFDVLHHLNAAERIIGSSEERLALAQLNLSAGQRARGAAAFGAAATYFATGLRFLPQGSLKAHHELAFELYLGSAECEYLSGRFDTAQRLFAELSSEASTDLERARILERKFLLHLHRGDAEKAMDIARAALRLLGVDLPRKASIPTVLLELGKAKRALAGRRPEDLLALPGAKDPGTQLAMRILNYAATNAYVYDRLLYAAIAMRMVTLSLARGHCSGSALAYVVHGNVLFNFFGDAAEAEAFGQLALGICERYPDRSVETFVKGMYASTLHWRRHPYRSATPYLRSAQQVALEAGNLAHTGHVVTILLANLTVSGKPISEVREEAERHIAFARQNGIVSGIDWLMLVRQRCRALEGTTRSTHTFDADDFSEAELLAGTDPAFARMTAQLFYNAKIRVLYLFEHHEEALALGRRAEGDVRDLLGLTVWYPEHFHFMSLVLCALADEQPPLLRQRYLFEVRRNQLRMRKWAEQAPENFRDKYLLVAAELARVERDDHAAIRHYEEAIAIARRQDRVHDEALALELAGKFYRSRNLPDVARMYLGRARQAYMRWGATKKVALMEEAHHGLGAPISERAPISLSPTSTATGTMAMGALDVPTMIKASQALSGEISLERLVARLLGAAVENAGAQRGALLLRREGSHALGVVAEVSPEDGARVLEKPRPAEEDANLPLSVVQYVARTQKSVILREAFREGAFVKDPVLSAREVQSVLCTPIVRQGELEGVLYLENNLSPGTFTEDRAQLLRVLCSQMAISIANAHLVANLEQMVEARTRELREAQARLLKLEKDATEVQMAGGFAHEMRNALSGARLLWGKIYRADVGEESRSLCVENSDTLQEIYLQVREHLAPDELAFVASAMKRINDNERDLDDALTSIGRALGRALSITQMILEYARLGKERPGEETVAVGELLRMILDDVRDDLAAHGIAAEVEVQDGCAVAGRPVHVDSIVRNLILNARDALAEKAGNGPRELRVTAAREAGSVRIRVSDTGIGIAPEHRNRLFEPFFTTKPRTGTGLGLGVVKKLVELYGGTISVESELGRGTTFAVALPEA
jgi:predicted ATPase/signal transduction histidine kinase